MDEVQLVLQTLQNEEGILGHDAPAGIALGNAEATAVDEDADDGRGFVQRFIAQRRRMMSMVPAGRSRRKKQRFQGSVIFDFCVHNVSAQYCLECKRISERAARLQAEAGKYVKMVKVGLPAQGVLLDMMAKEQFPQAH